MQSERFPARTRTQEIAAFEWDAFVRKHPHGHVLQTQRWGHLKSIHGWNAASVSVHLPQRELIGVALLLMRRLPFGLGRIAYVPRGPVVNWDNPQHVQLVLARALAAARVNGAFALVIEPDLLDTQTDRAQLAQLGFMPLDFHVQPRRTIWVNLDVDEEVDILAAMKPKTRYNIGLARRRGVQVRMGTPDDADIFYSLLKTTAQRDGFTIHPFRYYRDFLELFTYGEQPPARLFIAEYQDKPLAAVVVTVVGERATYLYGASSNEHRELMPTYLLQWEAMRWARQCGCKTYDLWGIPDEDEQTLEAEFEHRSDGLWGVYRFKRGFGGQVVRHIGAWVRVIAPVRWALYQLARKLHKSSGLAA